MLFSACQKEEIDSIPEGAIKLTTEGFSNGDGSKTSVNGYTVEWVNGDKVTINNEEYTVFVDGSTAYITPGEGSEPTAPSAPYYGYYSCGTVNEPSSTNPTVTVPASYSCSYDGSGRQVIALPMVSYQSSTASAIAFKHVTAAVKVMVKNEISGTELVLDKVVVTSSKYKLSGTASVTLADDAAPTVGAQTQDGGSSVTVTLSGSPTIAYDAQREVQVPILPIGSAGTLTVEVYTHESGNADNVYHFIKTVSGASIARNALFTAGCRISTTTGNVGNLVDLSTLNANYTAKNGDILTGTLGANVKISINTDGATVTLMDANINGSGTWQDNYNFAGITCLDNTTIILSGTNIVKGFNPNRPGIHIASGKTLSIQGTGSLTARSNGSGAGIGGGYEISCGSIVINGGIITARGGSNAAGIGGGYGSCGNITINGGTVTARGGDKAAGIGGGFLGSCGTITITNGVTSVTATKGDGATNSIGAGNGGTCGTVTIGGTVYWTNYAYQNNGAIYLTTSPLVYPIPSGAISGLFSVSSTKQVFFSRGNLKRVDGTWSFHTNQYDYLEGHWNNYTCDLFYWETTGNYGSAQICVTPSGTASDVVDWGTNMGSGWRTLTKYEWTYLFASHISGWTTIQGVQGYVIRPDNVTTPVNSSYTISEWLAEEAAGSVFLPAAGYRYYDRVNDDGVNGYYWSSSSCGGNRAYNVFFNSTQVPMESNNYRNYGYSVRLVYDAN